MNLPAMQKTQVRSLGQEDPLEKEMATPFSIPACEISLTEEHSCSKSLQFHSYIYIPKKSENICPYKNVHQY